MTSSWKRDQSSSFEWFRFFKKRHPDISLRNQKLHGRQCGMDHYMSLSTCTVAPRHGAAAACAVTAPRRAASTHGVIFTSVVWQSIGDSWKEIFIHFQPTFEDLSGDEKNKFGQMVMKKWTNMKDSWIKYDKKINECKSGSSAKKIRKYMFYDEMMFLKKNVEHRKTDSNMTEHVHDSSLSNENFDSAVPNQSSSGYTERSETQRAKKKRKNELSEVDIRFMKFMDSAERDEKKKSRSMNFFMGIADTVDKFSDENMIDFQFQVISIIKNIQQRQCTQYIPTSRNQWDQGHQGYLSGTASSNAQSSTYGYSTAARSSYGISRPQTSSHDFGHGSGLEPIHYRPESQLSVHSVNAESISADSQVSIEDEFDFSTALE
ncbi:uncharacterized protein LOC123667315 [Melitaea cinxia]|uniref:uncharacterized protein LOC123667315 n=1 Tax=Melitaea cinxia TaxID=113334 RepID=UPI001E26FF90|nr:uncharacterized protein LOC123667315 [Melitaea cinxia]